MEDIFGARKAFLQLAKDTFPEDQEIRRIIRDDEGSKSKQQ